MGVQATGRVTIKLESDQLRSKSGAELTIGGIQRDFDITDQLESFYKEKGQVAMIKATMVHCSDTDLLALQRFKNGTAYFETDTGHTYTISGAATAEVGPLSNGEVPITIGGDPAAE